MFVSSLLVVAKVAGKVVSNATESKKDLDTKHKVIYEVATTLSEIGFTKRANVRAVVRLVKRIK